MKLSKLNRKILKELVNYCRTHNKDFVTSDELSEMLSGIEENEVSQSLVLLKNNGLIKLMYADNKINMVFIKPESFEKIENDTLPKRLLQTVIQIKKLIN